MSLSSAVQGVSGEQASVVANNSVMERIYDDEGFEPFQFFNIVPFSPGCEEQAAQDMIEYVKFTGNRTVLYSLTIHPEGRPALKKAEFLVESYRKFRQALAGTDVQCGVLLQSLLGHWPRVDEDEEQWTRSIDIKGLPKRFCIFDSQFQDYIRKVAVMVAKEKPCFVMTDDDVRTFSPDVECFCPLHTAEFNRRTGNNFTSDEYRNAVLNSKNGDKIFTAFDQLRFDTFSLVTKLVRAGIDSVDPAIPAGSCMPYWERYFYKPAVLNIAGTHRPTLRLCNATYQEYSAKDFPGVVLQTQALYACYPSDWRLLDEADTFPHHLYSRSSRNLHAKLCSSIMTGLTGAKLWYVNAHRLGGSAVSRSYTRILAENSGLYQTLTKAVAQSQPEGVLIPLHHNFPNWHSAHLDEAFENAYETPNWADKVVGHYGIPFTCSFELNRKGVYLLCGENAVARYSDDELRTLLSGKVLLDGQAATALSKRGFDELLGVHAEKRAFNYTGDRWSANPKKLLKIDRTENVPNLKTVDPEAEVLTELYYEEFTGSGEERAVAPSSVFFRNKLGGTVVTAAFTIEKWQNHLLNEERKEWLLEVLDRLNGTPLPFVLMSDQNALALQRQCNDGSALLAFFNLNFDELTPLKVRCAKAPKSIELLNGDGTWQPLQFTYKDGIAELPLSLECYQCTVVRIK
jgi:hypothetical protein